MGPQGWGWAHGDLGDRVPGGHLGSWGQGLCPTPHVSLWVLTLGKVGGGGWHLGHPPFSLSPRSVMETLGSTGPSPAPAAPPAPRLPGRGGRGDRAAWPREGVMPPEMPAGALGRVPRGPSTHPDGPRTPTVTVPSLALSHPPTWHQGCPHPQHWHCPHPWHCPCPVAQDHRQSLAQLLSHVWHRSCPLLDPGTVPTLGIITVPTRDTITVPNLASLSCTQYHCCPQFGIIIVPRHWHCHHPVPCGPADPAARGFLPGPPQ